VDIVVVTTPPYRTAGRSTIPGPTLDIDSTTFPYGGGVVATPLYRTAGRSTTPGPTLDIDSTIFPYGGGGSNMSA